MLHDFSIVQEYFQINFSKKSRNISTSPQQFWFFVKLNFLLIAGVIITSCALLFTENLDYNLINYIFNQPFNQNQNQNFFHALSSTNGNNLNSKQNLHFKNFQEIWFPKFLENLHFLVPEKSTSCKMSSWTSQHNKQQELQTRLVTYIY